MSYLMLGAGVLVTGLVLFFALTNSALRYFSRARLEEALRQRGRIDELKQFYRHHSDLLEMARSLHILTLVVLTVLAEIWATGRFGLTVEGWLIGALVAAVIGVVPGGVIPLAWAKYAAESVLVATLPLCQAVRATFAPAHRVLRLFDGLVRRLAGVAPDSLPTSPIDEELRSVAEEGEREGSLDKSQKDMIERVIDFRDGTASQIMTPRTDILGIEAGASVREARHLIASCGHSRIPVTNGNIDTIVGILYAKDLLEQACGREDDDRRVKDICRPPLFVPETKKLNELLREFQGDKVHMAIVLDEYGGTAGLVTIEDVVEEIVGEIVDEYEQEPPKPIRPLEGRSFEVEARVRISEINSALALDLPEHEDYETIGGFVLSRLGYIPKAGEALEHEGARITVLEAHERRIDRLRIDLEGEKGNVK